MDGKASHHTSWHYFLNFTIIKQTFLILFDKKIAPPAWLI